MITIVLVVLVVVQWSIIGAYERQRRRQPKVISMTEVKDLALQVSQESGTTFTEALRGLVGVLNYGARFMK